jgi:hypothetical protein
LDAVAEPDYQWKTDVQVYGLNPEHYVIELSSQEIVNIYELYAELVFSESDALKVSLAAAKKQIHKSNMYEYAIAPKEYDFYGEPKDRDEHYYLRRLLKTDWANNSAFEFARVLAQGDSKQPLKTEDMIHLYIHNEQIPPCDTDTLAKLQTVDITINEWERAMVLKEMLYLQRNLAKEVENNAEIFLTEVMPKQFMYGQTVIYNPNKKAYCINGNWTKIEDLK